MIVDAAHDDTLELVYVRKHLISLWWGRRVAEGDRHVYDHQYHNTSQGLVRYKQIIFLIKHSARTFSYRSCGYFYGGEIWFWDPGVSLHEKKQYKSHESSINLLLDLRRGS